MNQISSTRPILGAGLMLGAGLAYAGVNVALPIITYQLGFASTSAVFWQYLMPSSSACLWCSLWGPGR